jgi:hypothetical protein
MEHSEQFGAAYGQAFLAAVPEPAGPAFVGLVALCARSVPRPLRRRRPAE